MPIIGFGGGFGGGSSYINGVVPTSADLPTTVGNPPMDSVYLAKVGSGVWLINRKPAGLYCRTANNGNAADWTYLGAFPEVNADGNWELYNTTDPTKELKFNLSGISAGNTRTLTVPDASGVIGIAATRTVVTYSTNQSLPATRNTLLVVSNTNASGINLDLPTTGTNDGDIYTFVGGGTVSGPIIIRRCVLLSPLTFTEIARIAATNQSHSFRATGSGSNNWELVSANWAVPSAIGSTTRNTGAFTTLSATGQATFSDQITGANATAGPPTTTTQAKGLQFGLLGGSVGNTAAIYGSFAGTPTLGIGIGSGSAGSITQVAAFTSTGLSVNGGTVTASAPVLDLAQTWNDAAVAFTGMRFNVTNTNSASASYLIDLQVGGAPTFRIRRDGVLLLGNQTAAGLSYLGTGNWLNAGNLVVSTLAFTGSLDVQLTRDAADTLAQRRGTAAQTFRLYNTFTDASNFERGFMRWSSNVLQIGTEKAGTGSARDLQFLTDNTARLTIDTSGNVGINITEPQRPFHISGGTMWARFDRTGTNGPAIMYVRQATLGNNTSVWLFGPHNAAGASNDDFAITDYGTNVTGTSGTTRLTIGKSDGQLTVNGNLNLSTKDLVTDTTTGTKIGTATDQKIGFWNATPVIQQSSTGTNATGFTANGPSNTVHADSTFTGNVGTTAYSISDIVKHLKTIGLIAS